MHKLQLKLKLLSSLVHTEETSSNIANIYREKMVVDGEIHEIPAYHGNAMRGTLRNLGFNHLLEAIEFPKQQVKLDVFHVMFSGGALDSMSTALDISAKKKIRDAMPLLSLLGSALGAEMLEGKLIVQSLYPECKELGNGDVSHWDMIQIVRYTRQDDSKGELGDVRLVPDERKQQQMLYDIETLIAGSVLTGEVIIDSDNPVEIGAFYTALEQLKDKPYIGGASRIGHGKIEILNNIDWNSLTIPYKKYLSDNKKEICNWINSL